MKKKTKFKLKNNLLLPFITTIFVCLLGVAVNSMLFYKSFFRALSKLNEKPIATITFKYKTAQRKFLERVVWDRLRQDSPVYNGDTIHTANLSEATIYFTDGNVMELAENTMAQVFLSADKSLKAELTGGFATVDSSESNSGMVLSTGGVEVALQSGSSLTASSTRNNEDGTAPGGMSLQVTKGNAVIQGAGSRAVNIAQGEAVSVSENAAEGSSIIQTKPLLIVKEPLNNSKILYHEKGGVKVPFRLSVLKDEKTSSASDAVIFISSDRNFKDIKSQVKVSLKDSQSEDANYLDYIHQTEFESGTYYWKVSVGEDDSSIYTTQTGRIQIIQSFAPSLIAPATDYEYSFRTRNPSVRLIWTESSFATSYRLEIAENPSMQNPVIDQRTNLASAIISTLPQGKYWWRVTPFYTVNKKGFASPSLVQSFSIAQKGNLEKVKVLVPANNAMVDVDENGRDIAFSWKSESEAVKYTLLVAKNEELKNPSITKTTSENFISFSGKAKMAEGKWYWAVRQEDSEGNTSEISEVRSVFAMKGKPEQHTIEPPSNYKSSAALLPDTKFTWKKNLPENFESTIEISGDENFSKILFRQAASGTSLRGVNLAEGTYWWRLVSKSTTDDTVLTTPSKNFSVVGNLDAATLQEPRTKAVARESVPYTFKWSEVADADYYKIQVFRKSDNALVHENTVYGTEAQIEMFSDKKFIDKSMYRWQVQANANAIPGISSRRTGRLAEGEFYLAKLRPVEIERPLKNVQIKGIDAILSPVTAVWSSVDKLSKAQFVLRKVDSDVFEDIIKIPSDENVNKTLAPNSVLLDTKDGLRPGKYEIIVYATTLDDIDVSNTERKNRGTFTVLPVEPLATATNLRTVPAVFDAEYLRNPENPRTITLHWAKVLQATDYFVAIKNKRGREVLRQNVTEGTSYAIDFTKLPDEEKSAFSNGTFTWQVMAVRRIDSDKDGKPDKILQEGRRAESTFTTNVPSPTKTKAKGAANPYGN